MSNGIEGPFQAADLETLNAQLLRLDELDRLIRLATRAGIDVTTFQQQARETRENMLRLKAAFFPGS